MVKQILNSGIYWTVVFVILRISGAVQWGTVSVLSPILATVAILILLLIVNVIHVLVNSEEDEMED